MAITTVGDIITSALSKVLVNNAQDTLSAADTQLAFDALGVLIDALGIERLACYALTTTAHPLTGGTGVVHHRHGRGVQRRQARAH